MTNLEFEDIEFVANSRLIDYSKFKNTTILISGGTGFIGSFLINIFKYRNERYNDNVKIISLSRKKIESDNTCESIQCDITGKINVECNIDYIIHLASNTHPKQYRDDPVGTITTNIIGCNNLLKLAREKKVKKFLLASSVEVYGEGKKYPVDELYSGYIDFNKARSGYNESKRLCEALCQSYKEQYKIDFVTARLSRIIGPDKKEDTKAIGQFMTKALNNEDIVLKSVGNQLFSYIYISDAVLAILLLLDKGVSGEAYNVAAEINNLTLGDYAKYIAKLANRKVIFNIESDSAASSATYALIDTKKIKKIGFLPKYTITEGLKRTFQIKKDQINSL